MVQFVGTYELVSQENIEAYLKGLESKEVQDSVRAQLKSPVVINAVDDKQIKYVLDGKTTTFNLNAENDYTSPDGLVVKVHVSKNSDSITFKTSFEGKVMEQRIWKVTDSGLTSTILANGVTAVQQFKRV